MRVIRNLAVLGAATILSSGMSIAHADAPAIDNAHVFFELNHTDQDLGIHAKVEADPWVSMQLFNHRRNRLLNIKVEGVLAWEGLNEFAFESAEPNFRRLRPEDFFDRYPEGQYLLVGFGLYGARMDRFTQVSHLLPSPPVVSVNGIPAATDCDSEDLPEFTGDDVEIEWEEVTHSHPTIGRVNEPVTIVNYEVVIEVPEANWKASTILPPDAFSFEVPEEILELAEEGIVKYEVLAREASDNQTAIESCFSID
jgi:hypothetical protein